MGSVRFPGKPIVPILGLPMIAHIHARCMAVASFDQVVIATCDSAIAEVAERYGATVAMTSSAHETAIDRTAEAADVVEEKMGTTFSHVVLVQGDEPFVTPETLANIVTALAMKDKPEFVNVMTRFAHEDEHTSTSTVKVVCNAVGEAMYMSREPIPSRWKRWEQEYSFKQTGLIGFARPSLAWFASTPRGAVEDAESVDMIRAIVHGRRVRMITSDQKLLGVDTPADLEAADLQMLEDAYFPTYRDRLLLK